jgi:hypothetical protein
MNKFSILKLLILINVSILWGQHNALETFTTANGLGNNGCSDILMESDGTLWVGHQFFSSPSLNGKPISRRLPNGNWDYPFTNTGLPVITVGGSAYQWSSFSVNKIYQTSSGSIWFLPKAGNTSDMNNAPPLLIYHNGVFSARHISLNNFPNKGAVHTMVEDGYGHIWFGCEEGLIKLDANNGQFSTFNPPVVNFGAHGNPHTSKRVFELDYDANNRILILTGHITNLTNDRSLLRVYTPLTNVWEYWSHLDAPWYNATQDYYAPANIRALRDGQNRVYVSSDGGGLYYIDNSNWSSHQLHQIADFVRGWSHPGYTFDHIYTNLPDFTRKLYLDPDTALWTLGINGAEVNAYKAMYQVPTTYNGDPATYHLFGFKQSAIQYNNNGTLAPSRYQAMTFYENEIWISCEHGIERWYYDSLNPVGSYIGIEGLGNKKYGAVGFNTQTNNALEPQNRGHVVPGNWPIISIDTAYYYLASSDYENLKPNVNAGIKGTGAYQGFSATAAALSAAGLSFEDIELRFGAIGLEDDVRDENWSYQNEKEVRHYEEWFTVRPNDVRAESFYEILINNHVIFKGRMPDFDLHIAYNRYGYLFDSIGGFSDPCPLIPYPNITDPGALSIKDSLLADIDGKSIRFVFRTIQTALDESIRTADRRGGLYQIFDAYLSKVDTVVEEAPLPMCGNYTIGQSINADYASFEAAVRDIHRRGIVCDVNFYVGKGSYVEQLEFGTYEGMDQFQVSFLGNGSGAELSYSPSHADSNYVLHIRSTANLRFVDLEFTNTHANYGRVFWMDGSCPRFELDSCQVSGLSNAPNNTNAIKARYALLTCNDCDDAKIRHNRFTNGSHGIDAAGSRIKVAFNEFEGQTGTAIDLNNGSEIQVLNNLILGPAGGNFNGIVSSGYPFTIANNQIINSTANCINAIYSASFSAGNSNQPAKIWNNEVSVNSSFGYGAGISVSCGFVSLYYNSINVLGNNSNFVGLQNFYAPNTWQARNNIIVNPNGVCFYTSRADVNQSFADSDYNLFYSSSASPFQTQSGFNAAVNIADLAAFQTASSKDANSLFLDPQFIGNDHLLPMNPAANGQGIGLANIQDRLGRDRPPLNPDQGCYEFDGVAWTGAAGSQWNNPLNWSDTKVPTRSSKVFVSPQNNHPIIDASVEVQDFVLHRDAQMRIRANAGLRVDSLLENSGSIILEADTNGSYARLIQGEITGGGIIRQEGVLRAADTSIRWFHLGVPVRTKVRDLANPQTFINAGANGGSIYFWNASSGQWECPSDTASFLEPGIGYAVAAGENAFGNFLVDDFPATIDVSGDLRAADSLFHLNLSYTSQPQFNTYVSQINDGWNFLANPYHAVYDMQGQSIPGSYKTVYVWNGTTYKQYNTQLDIGDLEARYLAPLQGFFIRTDSAQSLNGFNFDPNQRSLSHQQVVQKKGKQQFSLSVVSEKGSQKDALHILVDSRAQIQFEEEWDAAKLKNAAEHLNFYSLAIDKPVAINSLPESALSQGLKIGFEASKTGFYSIRLSADATQAYTYLLEDKLLDQFHLLDKGVYRFHHQVSNLPERFVLFALPQRIGLKDNLNGTSYWFIDDDAIVIKDLSEAYSIWNLFSLDGKLIRSGKKAQGTTEIEIYSSALTTGVYLLQFPDQGLRFKIVQP